MNPDQLREQIRHTVAAITALDAAEAGDQESVLAWVDSGAPLFREYGPVPRRAPNQWPDGLCRTRSSRRPACSRSAHRGCARSNSES